MTGDILIVKKRRGNKIQIKITKKMRRGYDPLGTLEINFKDFKDLALLFHDLKDLYGAPVDKAISEYKKGKTGIWPF